MRWLVGGLIVVAIVCLIAMSRNDEGVDGRVTDADVVVVVAT